MKPSLRHVSVAILAGGLGTRLRSVVADRPKVLAPVAGRPFIYCLLDQLRNYSVREAVLLTGHGADMVRATLGESYCGMQMRYSVEDEPVGTGGAVRMALPLLPAVQTLLLNGDSFCEVDLACFAAQHVARAADISLSLCQVDDTTRFGCVQVDRQDRVVRFQEKGSAGGGWINAGVYLLRNELIATIPPDRPVSLERDLLPEWVKSKQVYGHRSDGRFLDIGTPESYGAAEAFFAGKTEARTPVYT